MLFKQDLDKNGWLSHQQPLRGSWHNEFLSPQILVTFDTSLAPSGRFVPQLITTTHSPFLLPNAIFRSPLDKRL